MRRLFTSDTNDDSDTLKISTAEQESAQMKDVGVNTENEELSARVVKLEKEIIELKGSQNLPFCLERIAGDDAKVLFYTGFPSYAHLKVCFDFLGPAATQLQYRDSRRVYETSKKGRPRCLPPMEEFFLTLVATSQAWLT